MRVDTLKYNEYEDVKKLFREVFTKEPWFDVWDDEEQLDLYLHDLINNNNSLSLLLYDKDDKIIGGSLGYIFNWWKGKEYFIKEFFVSDKLHSKGYGSIFLKKIHEYLKSKDIKAIWLNTQKDVPAYSFYLKNDFKELKDAVLMYKDIK